MIDELISTFIITEIGGFAFYIKMGLEQSKLQPEILDDLHRCSDFSKEEILEKHKTFLSRHPSGHLQMEEFKEMYRNLVTHGDPSDFSEYVFRAFDTNGDGVLDFREFFIGLYITSRGTKEQKLKMAFKVYDLDGDGFITCDELHKVMESFHKVFYVLYMPDLQRISSQRFRKLDLNDDGRISPEEFMEIAKNDSVVLSLLTYFSRLPNTPI